jgi:hypothetical protein
MSIIAVSLSQSDEEARNSSNSTGLARLYGYQMVLNRSPNRVKNLLEGVLGC